MRKLLEECLSYRSAASALVLLASKIVSKNHGYEKTLQGVEDSLKRFEFGEYF